MDWTVLLIGGPSGTGKSTVAREIALKYQVPWLQVDDIRLALQSSGMVGPNPETGLRLNFFEDTQNPWLLPVDRLKQGFVDLAEVLSPAIRKVVTNHAATSQPIVIEGDAILPSLTAHPETLRFGGGGKVRAVFLLPCTQEELLMNLQSRGWGNLTRSTDELRVNAEAKWQYGQWLAAEARRYRAPVLATRPWESLSARIELAINSDSEMR